MYWTNPTDGLIEYLDEGGSPEILLDNLNVPCGLDFDFPGKRVYWTSLGDGKKIRSRYYGKERQELVVVLESPMTICVLNRPKGVFRKVDIHSYFYFEVWPYRFM